MTNSAGRPGAIPIWQIRRPFRLSSWVIVDRSQVMKKILQAELESAVVGAPVCTAAVRGSRASLQSDTPSSRA
jgi:hypothetical protein